MGVFIDKQRVCIVEDEPTIREIYQIELEKNGYEVFTASDGQEGLDIIKKKNPHIALIDIMMPKVNGIELMEMMKKDKELSKIPVIVLTNLSDEETIKKAGELESKFYLNKTLFKPSDVVGIVREALGKGSN
jgi:DNA-binding response OmpR family regulator